ncbi:pesticidal protein Cry7Aa [bacterium]|nr:pesticidal protein Cry7Aa [bacterium]
MKRKIEVKRNLLYEPSLEWEEEGVFNPTAIAYEDGIHIIYRAIKCENYSRLGYLKVNGNSVEKFDFPILTPTEDYEKQGVEDPRLTKIEDKFFLLYTAFDGKNARIAAAESENLLKFKKIGIVSPNITFLEALEISHSKRYQDFWIQQIEERGENIIVWDKDGCLFPEKIDGKYAMLHRIEPDVQIVFFDDFFELKYKEFWEEYFMKIEEKIVLKPKYSWEMSKIGAGPSPIKTDYGWLLLYHGVDKNRIYRAGVSLLELENPSKEISRLPFPLFEPSHRWEKEGNVANVVFPTGAILDGEILRIFYGCADMRIGIAEIELKDLLKVLLKKSSSRNK